MKRIHVYKASIRWSGNTGNGTRDYSSYSRNHDILIAGKQVLPASSDKSFRGDPARHTPEDLLVASLSGCHMLWYLHLCAINGVVVIGYEDIAEGEMAENADGSGQFSIVTLYPRVTVSNGGMLDKARSLHDEANRLCFIARSVNFPVRHEPEVICLQEV